MNVADDRDSDSSDNESEYNETKTLLGYASKVATDDAFSQLGGHPTWLDDKTAPPGDLARCKACNGYLTLLLQLNGDLPDRYPTNERRLYLFACRRKACRRKIGSVRGFRAIRPSSLTPQPPRPAQPQGKEVTPPKSEPVKAKASLDLGASIFGVAPRSSSLHFSESHSASQTPPAGTEATLSETFADKVRISGPAPPRIPTPPPPSTESWPDTVALPTAYPKFFLDADYETLTADPSASEIPAQAKLDIDMDLDEEVIKGSSARGDKDMDVQSAWESSMDKAFQKFADRMAQNPEQVLRYEYGSLPLLYSKTDAVGSLFTDKSMITSTVDGISTTTCRRAPNCPNCGAERTFELQLTPNAIMELEAEEMELDGGMEWGTIILMVCSRDCLPRYKGFEAGMVGYLEEWAGVQWEELVKR